MKFAVTALILALCGNALADAWGVARGADGTVLKKLDTSGAAALTDADLPEGTVEIAFKQSVQVATIALTNRTLKFTGDGKTLTTDGKASPFQLSDGNWTFEGLTVDGPGTLPKKAHYYGGAIDCLGGTLTVTNCTFTKLVSRFNGGAISARLMDGDVVIADSTFTNNLCGPINGTGGAIYASANACRTVVLRLCGCTFCVNSSQSGGAVTTVCTTYDEEVPVELDVRDCTFDRNTVNYNGGAAFIGGDAIVSNTLFSANGADVQGGAICTGVIAEDGREGPALQIRSGTVFRGNRATANTVWTCGGAIALWGEGASLDVDGRHVVFAGNKTISVKGAYGGAIYAATGTMARLSLAQFLGNEADTGGGAVFAEAADLAVLTSIFSNNTVTAAGGYGGAVSAESATLTVSNSTVRGSNAGAVDACGSQVTLVNCVVADNGEADISVFGDGASLRMDHTAYGRAAASVAVVAGVITNACISGIGASVFKGDALYLDSAAKYTPVAAEGLVQTALDHEGVAYGSRPEGHSMGAYECATPMFDPVIVIKNVTWYHNRSTGYYYPRIEIEFVGGDARRIEGVTFMCDGEDHELPQDCVDQLKGATTPGQVFSFGVNPATFEQFASSPENWGFVPEGDRLFGLYKKTRPVNIAVEMKAELRVAEVTPVSALPKRMLASTQKKTVPVPTQFTDFSVGESLSGRAEVMPGAKVRLLGCAALGDAWVVVGELAVDADGRFTTAVPEGLRFFKLEGEVAR